MNAYAESYSLFRIGSTFISCLLVIQAVLLSGCLDSSSSKKLGDGHDFGENNREVVLVLGDSISAGGYSGGAPWPARFGNMIGKTVINESIGGATASVGAARVQAALRNHKPGFLIIFYGANDAIQGVDVNATENAMRAMVSAAKRNQTIPVMATVMPMEGERRIYNGRVDRVNERIRSIASSERVKLVNLHRTMRRRNLDEYYADGLHLNDLGEELVALEFLDAFK